MKCLYLTFNDPENKSGLFYSTHERIKNAVPLLNSYKIYNILFYDNWQLSLLKSILKLKVKKIQSRSFLFDGLEYENLWLKRGLFSSVTPWGFFEKFRVIKLICNEKFLEDNKISTLINTIKSYDFIMAHWSYPNGSIAMKISNVSKVPYFITCHGSDINSIPLKNKILRKYINEALNKATYNIMVSKALSNNAKKLFNINSYISHNGVSENIISRNIKDYNSIEIFNILFIGNLNEDKRADKLTEIIKNIHEKAKRRIHFSIIGKGKYEKLIKNNLINSKIDYEMTGHLTQCEVLKYLEKSDILILPSRREGLPLVILESIAKGVIPVACNVGGISEILEKDFLVDEKPSFITDFSDKIIDIINFPIFPQLNIQNYTWKRIIKSEIEFIKQINESKRK